MQLLVDEQERQKERMVRLLERRGIESSVKGLPTGDYVWTVRMGGTEMVSHYSMLPLGINIVC